MLWVVLFLVLAVAAVAVLVGYVVWLTHKAADLLSEIGHLGDRAGELADLLSQVGSPPAPGPGRDGIPGLASPRSARW